MFENFYYFLKIIYFTSDFGLLFLFSSLPYLQLPLPSPLNPLLLCFCLKRGRSPMGINKA